MNAEDFNPLIPETFDSPYGVYSDLRARCPVAHSNAWGGFWALTRYEDVRDALVASNVFISDSTRRAEAGIRLPPAALASFGSARDIRRIGACSIRCSNRNASPYSNPSF